VALNFYRGKNLKLYGDAGDGLSTVVSRDTMEAVESMMPGLVRPFVAGEEVVSFEPVGPEDEEGAKQSTDYVNHVFTTHNNAFKVVYDSMKDGLLFRLGVAKTVMEEEADGPPTTYEGLNALQLATVPADELAGPAVFDEVKQTYTITVKPKLVKRYRVYIVAPDEFLYEERLASLDSASFLGHSKQVSIADLIDMGVDEKKARELTSRKPTEESDDLHDGEDEPDDGHDGLSRMVWVDECYIRCDYDNTGVLEWRKVLLGGGQSEILSNEPISKHPFSAWTPIPVPHRLVGMGIHDLTRDIQMNKTALQRELNNAMYLANRPMRTVLEGSANINDLLNPSVGGLVRVTDHNAVQAIPSGGEAAFSAGLSMIEYLDGQRESRTGVTRYNQGMDANSLNKTATGMNIIASASQQRQELIARQYAEFLKDVFRNLLMLVSEHGEPGEVIRLRGKWVEVDPSDWKTNYDMTVSVGLGTNNKDQLVGQLQSLLGIQTQIIEMQGGVQGPLVTLENAYETLKRLQEAMGLKGEKYFTDPTEQQQQLPPPAAEEEEGGGEDAKIAADIKKEEMRGQAARDVAHIRGQYQTAAREPEVVPFPVPVPAEPEPPFGIDPNMGMMGN
jgi:hypothetical protein